MQATPKTIQIFLPGGDPQGIRIAEITTRIVQVIEVPRTLLQDFLAMPESAQVALYFLVGESEDRAEQKVYIGQTGDLRTRLNKHNKDRDFWERALVLVSRTNSLPQTHALFLEWHCLQAARNADRYIAENGNSGSKPHTPAPLEADCHEIFDTGKTLLATLGQPIFDPVVKKLNQTSDTETFYCKASGTNGRGIYTPEGFAVLKDSVGKNSLVPSATGTWIENIRTELIQAGTISVEGTTIRFKRDHLFKSPSGAAAVLIGAHANGWINWKTVAGKTLDSHKRQ